MHLCFLDWESEYATNIQNVASYEWPLTGIAVSLVLQINTLRDFSFSNILLLSMREGHQKKLPGLNQPSHLGGSADFFPCDLLAAQAHIQIDAGRLTEPSTCLVYFEKGVVQLNAVVAARYWFPEFL